MQDFKRLLQYIIPYKRNVFLSIGCHIMMALFTVISIPLVIPFFQILFSRTPVNATKPSTPWDVIQWLEYFFVGILDDYGTDKAILFVCGAIVLTFLFKNLFRYLAMFFMVPVRSGVVKDLRTKMYNHYLDLNHNQRHKNTRGDLITRITADVQEVEWSVLRFIETIFKSPVIIIGSILLMLSINAKLTLFVFVLMLFTGLVIGTLSKTLKKQSLELQNKLSSITGAVDESLDGALMIDVFQVKPFWKSRFEKFNKGFSKLLNKVSWRQDLSSPLSEFLGVTVVVVLLWYGSKLVLNSELNPETFFAFIFAFYNVIEPSKSFSSAFYNVKKGAAALERIDQLFEGTVNESVSDASHLSTLEKGIEFKNISFSYGQDNVLNNINFSIKAGEKVAIVGPSGSGKSTLIQLLLKKLIQQKGQILIDGIPLKDCQTSAWYDKIGLVTQKAFLYNDTVLQNITLGRVGISEAQIKKAINLSQSSEFVSKLKNGLDTVIGDRGDQLSGGEQQRLTIARALLNDPKLIIFDEPTSALDPESERKVSEAIFSALENRTAIVIAHRISTIKQMDRIFVLKDGQIIESGKHEDLIKNAGVYAEYVEMQSLS